MEEEIALWGTNDGVKSLHALLFDFIKKYFSTKIDFFHMLIIISE